MTELPRGIEPAQARDPRLAVRRGYSIRCAGRMDIRRPSRATPLILLQQDTVAAPSMGVQSTDAAALAMC